jgi:hypothetical protein
VHRDAEIVAGFLRVEEAEMLTELLNSAGIQAWFEGAVGSTLGPLIPGAGGGAKLLVRSADAAQARELIAASGVFRGEDGPAAEIPEAEWAAEGPQVGGRSGGGLASSLYPLLVVAGVVAATVIQLIARP